MAQTEEHAKAREEIVSTRNSNPVVLVQSRIANVTQQLARFQQKEGNFSKMYVMDNAKILAPDVWWELGYLRQAFTTELASVAKRVLAQPSAASAAERNWSMYGFIKDDRRNRLGHESVLTGESTATRLCT